MIRHRKPAAAAGRSPAWRPLGALLALGLWLTACGADPNVDARWPEGALFSGRRDAVVRLLGQLAQLEDTPLAHAARDLSAALPECPELEARAPDLARLPEALGCADPEGTLAGLRRYRGEAHVALALPVAAGPRVLVKGSEDAEHTRIEIHWPRTAASPSLTGWLPGEAGAGPPVLSGRERVLHARVRSDDLDIASLFSPDGQAAQLFQLRSELLSSALLDGTWEVAIYPPTEGGQMPRIAAALGVRLGFAARGAARRFLDEIESQWPLRREPLALGDDEGVCLPGLNLLPELAPCLVATEHALLLGWNATSLRHALERAPLAGDGDQAGRLEIDFARLSQADQSLARLQGIQGDPAPVGVTRWPWQRLVAHGARRGEAIVLHVDVEPRSGGSDS